MRTLPKIVIGLFLLGGIGRASAQSLYEQASIKQVQQAQLTISAFECAVVTTDSGQDDRLFNLAIKNGRDFIATIAARPILFMDRKIPKVWRTDQTFTEGFLLGKMPAVVTPDFILGKLYAAVSDEISDKLTATIKNLDPGYPRFDASDKKMEKIIISINDKMFQEKNCALLK